MEVLAIAIRKEKEIKGIQIGEESPKDCTRKLLELINEYSKVTGYKINTEKSLAFPYTNNEKIERENKETIPFTVEMKRISKALTVCR